MTVAVASDTEDVRGLIRRAIWEATVTPFGGAVSVERLSYLLHRTNPPLPRRLLSKGALHIFLRGEPSGFWVLYGDDHQSYVGLAPHGMSNEPADGGRALERALTYMLAEQTGQSASLDEITRWYDGMDFAEIVRFIAARPGLFRFLGPPSFRVILRPTGRHHRRCGDAEAGPTTTHGPPRALGSTE